MKGNAVVVDSNSEVVLYIGKYRKKVAARSTAKLIQVLPVYLLGLDKKYGLDDEELVIMSSSQLAQKQHVCVLEGLLNKTGIREEEICIGLAAPAGRIAYNIWSANKAPKRKIYHTCVGNHIAMMLAQRELSGSTVGYATPESQVQRWIRKLMAYFCEYPESMIGIAPDGCGVPTYILPMKNIAIAYKNMVSYVPWEDPAVKYAVNHQRQAIWMNPRMLEGDGCLSTILSSRKGMIAKTGAGGLLALGIEQSEYGMFFQSDTGDWNEIADMVDIVLKKLNKENMLHE